MFNGDTGFVVKNFTGYSGSFKISATWKIDLKVSLSLTGSNCANSSAHVLVALDAFYVNLSGNATDIPGGHFKVFHNISSAVSSTWSITKNVSLTWNVLLNGSDKYLIGTGFAWGLLSDIPNPYLGHPYSCSGSASVKPSGGTALATVLHIVLV